MGSPLGIIIEFGANSQPAQQDIEKLQQKIASMSTESAQSIERFSQRGIAAYEELQREYIRLGTQSANLRAALLENESRQRQLNQVIAAGGAGAQQAAADLQRLEAEHNRLNESLRASRNEFRAVSQASSAMMRENTLARENARSLAASFGLELPEAVGHFISQSKLAQQALASLFNVTIITAFAAAAVEGIEKIIDAYHEWQDASEGQKKELEEIIKEQNQLLTHAPTLAISQNEIDETTRRLGELAKQIEAVRAEQESLGHTGGIVHALSPIGMAEDIGLAIRDHNLLNQLIDKESQLRERLKEQMDRATELEKKYHEESTKASEKAAEAAARQAQIYERARQAIASARVELPPFIAEIGRLDAAIEHQNSGLRNSVDILKSYQQITKEMPSTPAQLGLQMPSTVPIDTTVHAIGELTAAQYAALPSTRELQAAVEHLAKAYPQLEQAQIQVMAQTKLQDPAFRQAIDASIQGMQRQSNAMRQTAQVARESFTIMGEAVSEYGGTFGRVFGQVSRIIELMINLHHAEAVSSVQASATKAAGEAAATGKVSLVKSVFETAEGIAALARLDFRAAAAHFAASAKFLSVLGIAASVAGSFASLGAGSGGGSVAGVAAAAASGGPSGATGDHSLASGAASAQAAGQSQQNIIQVHFSGPVYGGRQGVKELVQHIANAVKFDRLYLPASHTINGRSLR